MTLNEIAAKLVALGCGTLGTDLFIGYMPATPDACCAVYEYGGAPPDFAFGSVGVSFESPSIQVVFRGAAGDYAGPRAKAETAYRGLAGVEAATLSVVGGTSAFYHWVHPNQAPFLLDRDGNQRVLIACNYSIEKEPSA